MILKKHIRKGPVVITGILLALSLSACDGFDMSGPVSETESIQTGLDANEKVAESTILKGAILQADKTAADSAKIWIYKNYVKERNLLDSTYTNDKGLFSFEDLPTGDFELVYKYNDISDTLKIDGLKEKVERTLKDIRLEE